jgi:hypothetical protein
LGKPPHAARLAALVTRAGCLAPVLLVMLAGACRPKEPPDAVFLRLERAVAAGSGVELYRLLDPATQQAVDGAYRDERLMRTIIAAKYPEKARAEELQHLAAAAEDDVERYFAKVAEQRRLFDTLRRRLGSVSGPVRERPDGTDGLMLSREDGLPFRLRRTRAGWRFVELQAEWALERDRADHAVKTVHDNAALYKKAGE